MVKEKELSSADKCRRTKLRKKSIDELVNIILRKDDVERKSSKTIDTYKKLQLTNEKRIEILKDSLDKSEEIQSNQEKTIYSLNAPFRTGWRFLLLSVSRALASPCVSRSTPFSTGASSAMSIFRMFISAP